MPASQTVTANQTVDDYVAVVDINEIQERQVYATQIDGVSIAISLSKGEYFAVENSCSHAASTFDEGRVKGFFIICPLHGVMFDLRTGEPKGPLAKRALRTYATRVSGNMLEVSLT